VKVVVERRSLPEAEPVPIMDRQIAPGGMSP
jgi:hypothetical protein